ncbi:hypothetical protein P9847_05480 [Paenibacillus chibensis]|uniref:Uncharacterized protein n=1 Tax=Paenibacillus chibensis TaxID=59846 RepID=A0ABU6PPF4_9BACL|nr:hypothetical protein [Paenibacillus chibensis]
MKKRKTYLYSSAIFIILFGFGLLLNDTASNSSTEEKYTPGVYTIHDLAVEDTQTNHMIKIGMTKEDVTNLLGKETEIQYHHVYNFNGLRVYFKDNKVAAIMIDASENITNRYKTTRGVGLGTELSKVLERYGEEEVRNEFDNYFVTYMMGNQKGKKLIQTDKSDVDAYFSYIQHPDQIYLISFAFFDNDHRTLWSVMISDYMTSSSMMDDI